MERQNTGSPRSTDSTDNIGRNDGTGRALAEPGTPARCARCGAEAGAESSAGAEGVPLTWTCSVENRVHRYFCDRCARENLRAIEGRLDSPWW
ncbi:hypothetical protein [Streptomyces uncialis]|uniref:hypothetical protein n=1 Tax=Streptomyces uncialis TaxID=1048205 RepID=UPI000A58CBA9|nr:hypothetical protein [Streptomyces uncialis]MCX4660237.1 hypothetical protein [Streptomyces uncialis]